MAAIIENQRIVKRKKASSFLHNNKSAGFNAGFMSQFSQKPIRKKRKAPSFRQDRISLKGLFSQFRRAKGPNRESQPSYKIRGEKLPKNRASSTTVARGQKGFSFSVPSLPALAVIAGTVVIALAALNWEDINITIPKDYVYKPQADSGAERHTMLYAATGITGILPSQVVVIGEEAASAQAEGLNVPDAENDLITFEWQQYKVKRGDSVSLIAQNFGVSVGAIIASNEIRNARTLQEGATLRIPNIDGIPYQIKNGDSLLKIAASFNVPLEVILDVNDIKSDNIKPGETLFIPGARMNDIDLRLSLGELFVYPVQSRFVTSPYGMRRDPISGVLNFHTGIDLRADTGTTVMAALDGLVSVVSENRIYGKYIIMTHDNGYKTLYAHLNSFSVKQGDRVARGRKIGESGNTGYSTGPHLHFSIYDRANKLINPIELLR
ncbi:MAG: M23 family metallopeptidase [Treponema sp.]|jgi:murein DD-endopeptidase MepM/ murein hydrolase activator NlpD|nr:M23 family metallopeptidase [Treponema sp.]